MNEVKYLLQYDKYHTIPNSLEANFICLRSAYADMRRSHGRRKTVNLQKKGTGAKQKLWLFLLL